MSVRTRRQKIFSLFILALAVAVVAGAAGFATGYGTESEKRIKLVQENKALTEENKILSEIEIDIEKTEALSAENEELKAKVEELTKENGELKEKLTETEGALSETKETLEITKTALTESKENVPAESAGEVTKQSDFMDKITMWFIVGIVGVLVIMGIMMLLVPKKQRCEDIEEEEDTKEDVTFEAEETKEAEEVAFAEGISEDTKEFQTVDSEAEQTEIVFSEASYEEKTDTAERAAVPDSLEELMLESIKRKEQ